MGIEAKAVDMDGKDDLELGSPMGYSPGMTSDWRYGGTSLTDTSVGLVPLLNSVAVNKEDFSGSSSYASASMDSFGATIWDHPMNRQNLGFGDINVHNHAGSSSMIGIRKSGPPLVRTGDDRTPEMGWSPTSSLLNGSVILPNGPGMLPQSLSQIPTDSAFIERAARFSCFSGGNFSDVVNAFSIPQPLSISYRSIGLMPSAQELAEDNLKPACEGQSQKKNTNVDAAAKDASLSIEHQGAGGSPLKIDRSESLVRSNDGEKQGVDVSGNESDEAEFSGGVNGENDSSMFEGTGYEHSTKLNSTKKRKRVGQKCEKNQVHGALQHQIEAPKDNPENQQKGNQKAASTSNKTNVKHGKQGPQASDNPKEEYIHVRARRGQATNSHSLAERVRREKISERMKFLQDLVPGCSKVTGKAVMLDEIINYVQSLQRQVEFLSMKLATVNPRLDFNIEGLLTKDVTQQHASTSSAMGLSHDNNMIYPPVHPSHSVMVQEGLPVIANSSDFLPQLAPLTGGYKEHTQLLDAWDDELHNVFQMSYGMTLPLHSQDTTFGSVPGDRMKVEL